MKKYEIMIKKGREMLVKDFNFKQVIDFFHKSNCNIKTCEHNNNLTYIPVILNFDEQNDEDQYSKNEEVQKQLTISNDNPFSDVKNENFNPKNEKER